MQQGGGGLAGDPTAAVRRTCHNPFEQAQHGVNAVDRIEGGDKVHFGGTGMGETNVDATIAKGLGQRLRTIRGDLSSFVSSRL